jgi:RNase H-fold protein (predicted Holliday junction resolvase)
MTSQQTMILGFDPGRHKCGLAVMGLDRSLHFHDVVAAAEILPTLEQLQTQFPIFLLVMGDQTSAKEWQQRLSQGLQSPLRMTTIDERYSSLEARQRYWQMYPPRGLTRLVPEGMRTPPRPVDDIVAIVLIERYLERLVEDRPT